MRLQYQFEHCSAWLTLCLIVNCSYCIKMNIASMFGGCCRPAFQSKSVYHSFRPLFIYSRCFGLIPFAIQTNLFGEVQRVKSSFLNLAWPCIAILLYLSIGIFDILTPNNPRNDLRTTYILVLGDQIIFVSKAVMSISSVLMDLVNRKRILRNIQRFEAFDKEVWTVNHFKKQSLAVV